MSTAAKAEVFRKLNTEGNLLLPNAWDAASARVFEEAGFAAIGTTSAGIAYGRGLCDAERIGREAMMGEIAVITASVDVPVTADIEAGYGTEPRDIDSRDDSPSYPSWGSRRQFGGQCTRPREFPSLLFDWQLQRERLRAARTEAERQGIALTDRRVLAPEMGRLGPDSHFRPGETRFAKTPHGGDVGTASTPMSRGSRQN